MSNFLVVNFSRSPAYVQHEAGLFQYYALLSSDHKRTKGFRVRKIADFFPLILNCHISNSVVILLSPSWKNILALMICSLYSSRTFFWIHEPSPTAFFVTRSASPSLLYFLKVLVLSYLYNPICALLSYGIIYSSESAYYLIVNNFLGVISRLLKKTLLYIPLIYSIRLSKFIGMQKSDSIAICGTLNPDKGIMGFPSFFKANPTRFFSILVSSHTYSRNSHILDSVKSMLNVNVVIKNDLSDDTIYEHISSHRYILLDYTSTTQSGILPLAEAFSTIPLISNIPSFKIELFYSSSAVLVLDNSKSLHGLDSIDLQSPALRSFHMHFVSGQMLSIINLGNLLGAPAQSIAKACTTLSKLYSTSPKSLI